MIKAVVASNVYAMTANEAMTTAPIPVSRPYVGFSYETFAHDSARARPQKRSGVSTETRIVAARRRDE